ncbi:hypothetical protein ACFQ3R_06040 [Mesonia ostreae]|uniref:Uncharacterized protein n=1 Tax=Mesonia ostreae TaxID=861110 RepID=A0ABU2KHF0_9FLAO|nr:hypothetical protein [Mesonia ostreae]MDT0294099.1 hypothetical protein [Mesonia ostreae]
MNSISASISLLSCHCDNRNPQPDNSVLNTQKIPKLKAPLFKKGGVFPPVETGWLRIEISTGIINLKS